MTKIMDSMKNILTIALISVMLYSCGNNEREDSMERTLDCLESKVDDGSSKFNSINDALTAYDFESARSLLSCYEDVCFNYNGDIRSCAPDSWDTEEEAMATKIDENPFYKELVKIVKSEISYFLKNSEYNTAKNSALEAGMFSIYKNELPNAINNLIDQNKVSDAISILSKYTFEYSYELTSETRYNPNNEYNDEANYFNDMVNSVFTTALFNQNKDVLKKCLWLYGPLTEDIVSKKNSEIKCKLIHNYKQTAKTKLKEAGITL